MKNYYCLIGENKNIGKVILISPPDAPDRFRLGKRKGRLWDLNLGLLSLATSLLHNGWEFSPSVQISEFDLLNLIDKETFLGISVLPSNYLTGLQIAKQAKDYNAKYVIMGGPYASSRCKQIIENHLEIDFVVSGPGEEAIEKLLNGTPLYNISGVTFRDSNGKVCCIPKKDLPLFKRYTPLRYLWQGSLDHKLLSRPCTNVYWQDGCSIALREPCIFCTIDHPKRLSRSTCKQVISEMKQLHSLGFGAIEDGGNDFPVGGSHTIRWLKELSDMIYTEGLDFHWLIHATSKALAYPGIIEALHKVGVRIVQIGFESGDSTLKIKRKTNPLIESKIIHRLNSMDMKIYGAWVMGMPNETSDSLKKTVSKIYELYNLNILSGVMLDPLWPGPGSPSFNKLCKIYPKLSSCDYIAAEELLNIWFKHFTSISFEESLYIREELLSNLDLPIIGGMLL